MQAYKKKGFWVGVSLGLFCKNVFLWQERRIF